MQLVPVDVIQVNSQTGGIRPLRFRVEGRGIDVDRIISSDWARSASGVLLICECESMVDEHIIRYKLTYDPKVRIWYASRK